MRSETYRKLKNRSLLLGGGFIILGFFGSSRSVYITGAIFVFIGIVFTILQDKKENLEKEVMRAEDG